MAVGFACYNPDIWTLVWASVDENETVGKLWFDKNNSDLMGLQLIYDS